MEVGVEELLVQIVSPVVDVVHSSEAAAVSALDFWRIPTSSNTSADESNLILTVSSTKQELNEGYESRKQSNHRDS